MGPRDDGLYYESAASGRVRQFYPDIHFPAAVRNDHAKRADDHVKRADSHTKSTNSYAGAYDDTIPAHSIRDTNDDADTGNADRHIDVTPPATTSGLAGTG